MLGNEHEHTLVKSAALGSANSNYCNSLFLDIAFGIFDVFISEGCKA